MHEHFIGETLGRYRIAGVLSEQRAGAQYLAEDLNLQRLVRLLIFSRPSAERLGFEADFGRMARAAARISHPNLARLLDFGKAGDEYIAVMEYLPGEDLKGLMKGLRAEGNWLTPGEALELVRQLALAADYARNQGGAPHLAPGKVKIRPIPGERLPYQPVLLEPGLLEWLAPAWRPGEEPPAYDPAYLSPEESAGQPGDSRSDVYALGVLLFELATGQLPFPIQSREEAVRYHTRQPVPAPRALRPDLPEALEGLLLKALEKNPSNRFPDAAALARELESVRPAIASLASAPPAFRNVVGLLSQYRRAFAAHEVSPPFQAPQAPLAGAAFNGPTQPDFQLLVENAHLAVDPGSSVSSRLILVNRASASRYFRVTAEGLPENWLTINPQVLQLLPGDQRDLTLTIQPPRSSFSRAGRYPLVVRAAPEPPTGRSEEAHATLTVGAFSQFRSELRTPLLTVADVGQVSVTNLGNTPDTYSISFSDAEASLAFTPPEASIRLVEGQSGGAEFRAALRQPRWIGGERLHPLRVQVSSSAGETQVHNGEFLSRAFMPAWVVGIALLLCLCLVGLSSIYLSQSNLQARRATGTVLAAQTGTAAFSLSTSQAETATAAFLSNANLATLQAVTATAGWLERDDDSDGLSNRDETEAGTSPSDADSDDDGLSDGDEINRGTDPLRPDSDGDGLADGDEVRRNLDPRNADTDRDGIPDSQDSEPLQSATPAPNREATEQVAANATAAAQSTSAAATAQAGAAGTAEAGTATAQAIANLTGTAAAATATPQPATPTPLQQTRLAYLHLLDTVRADEYQSFLEGNGFAVDRIPLDAISSTDFDPYAALIVGPDTGSEGAWGDEAGEQARALEATGLPILGLGQGGASLFGRLELAIGWPEAEISSGMEIAVVDAAQPFWSNPNPLAVTTGQAVALYAQEAEVVSIDVPEAGANLDLIGQLPDESNRHPLLVQDERYALWGFNRGPADMTPLGQQLLENILDFLISP